uniref:Uncharacterized protein n=1 Tax=Anguilla anguilla TaxID=7936 RepID=A0A0E9QVB4_ANGAN
MLTCTEFTNFLFAFCVSLP